MPTSVVIVREQGGKRRQVNLVGAALPFMGAAWGGSMVMNTNWNPGNPNATQQVLVPIEMPSGWEGEWNTNRLAGTPPTLSEGGGAPRPMVRADTVRNVMEDIFRSGQELSVVWVANENRRVSRFGRAKTWDFKHRGADDIHWNVTFDWSGRARSTPSIAPDEGIIASVRAASLRSSDAASYAEAARINSENAQVPKGPTAFTLGQLEQLATAPQRLVAEFTRLATAVDNRFRHITDTLVKVRDQPAAIANLVLAAATDAIAVSNDFLDRMSRPGPEQMTTEVRVLSLVRAARYYSGAQTTATLLAEASLRAQRASQTRQALGRPPAGQASTLRPGDLLDTYVPRQGDTMASITIKFYKDDGLMRALCKANGLPISTLVPPRTALIIPQRAVLDRLSG